MNSLDNENKFWLALWGIIAIAVCFLALLTFLSCISEKLVISRAADPIATACALGSTGSTIPASCLLSQTAVVRIQQ